MPAGPAAPSSGPTPSNTACPVTSKPVDPRFVILHEGRAIGFCCPNCPKKLWSNPAKYAGVPAGSK